MPRLFIGIGLPDIYRQSLSPLIEDVSGLTDASVNWSKLSSWHLTLKFLGETDEAHIPAIRHALAAVDFTAFTMRAGGAGAFPDAGRPKVLWLGLTEGREQCAALARSIEDALAAIGVPREKKPFRPHLTLGRVRKPGPGDWKTLLDHAAATNWPAFPVNEFILWQSVLDPAGAIHTPLVRYPLG
ncbi:RNA 2',3'-cyclic phosphodiesterase [Desulfovibrio sp. Fe33]|uniref:RNA 2',3'-cyclic phosphodiesterase n=1 Tax=Desulfovibrio sp. Fe33 TaxID=3020842 RepID=UPI00234E1F58|nr:RNA 2',3'-cyclic phosphodiesterase [Desulfovibrio sp. Fe33]